MTYKGDSFSHALSHRPANDLSQKLPQLENWRSLETCLSQPVKELFQLATTDQVRNVVGDDCCLSWPQLSDLLISNTSAEKSDLENYKSITRALAPVFSHVAQVYRNIDDERLCDIEWIADQRLKSHLAIGVSYLKTESPCEVLLGTLLITALMERALGNLVLLRRKFVPPLLKDLLSVEEMADLIGDTAVKCLQAVIGPPSSLNVRNLLWHSFLLPGELCSRFGYFLIALMKCIDQKLKLNDITGVAIPARQTTVYEDDSRLAVFPMLDRDDLESLHKLLAGSPIVMEKLLPLWHFAFSLFDQAQYGLCSVLVVCLFENSLRLLYASLNGLENRILSAQSYEFYTTYSEILSRYRDKELLIGNELVTFFDRCHLELMMDVFFNSEGLRLRDRLSHGQVDLISFPKSVANHLLSMTFCIVHNVSLRLGSATQQLPSKLTTMYATSLQYKARFHLSSDLQLSVLRSLEHLKQWQVPQDQSNAQVVLENIAAVTVPSLFRPEAEMSLVVHIRQVGQALEEAARCILSELRAKSELLQSRSLRSRQRENFEKLQSCQYEMNSGLVHLSDWLFNTLYLKALQHSEQMNDKAFLKKFKRLLQYTQNFSSAAKENKWNDCLKHYCNIKQCIEMLDETILQLDQSLVNDENRV